MRRVRPMARSFIRVLPVALAIGCSRAHVAGFREVGRFVSPNMHALYPDVTHFVAASSSVLSDRGAVLDYSRHACADDDVPVCFVLYWADETKAAVSFPIGDGQAGAIVASYNRNRSTGND